MNPTEFRPRTFDQLVGPAREVGRIVAGKIARLTDPSYRGSAKTMFYGPPGTGKTELASLMANGLAGDRLAIEEISGLKVNIDVVKHWIGALGLGGLFGDWQVKVVHEIDRMPTAAQDLMLDYLDKLPARCAFIGTSNMQIDLLQERFQTRMQTWQIMGPDTETIAAFIREHWPQIAPPVAMQIAVGSGGNMRAAMLDTESELDVQMAIAA